MNSKMKLSHLFLVGSLATFASAGCGTSERVHSGSGGASAATTGGAGGLATNGGSTNVVDAGPKVPLIDTDGSTECNGSVLASSFTWHSTTTLVTIKSDATHDLVAIKDPTIVYYDNKWHVYATSVDRNSHWSMVYLNFTDFSEAANAPQQYISSNPNFKNDYHCAPQLFYFRPQKKWYLIYQSQQPQYSTTDDPTKPETWSAPQNFFTAMPDIMAKNVGAGTWLDYWVICDTANCYLFNSDNNGHWYRSETTIEDFPNGFGNTTIVLQDSNRLNLFEASNVYKLKGLDKYLALVEALGPNGQRYFRSWTANTLDGEWTSLADTWDNPFANMNNVSFDPLVKNYTWDISHGEMLRDGYDETLTIDSCNLHYLYQAYNPFVDTSNYAQIPWRLALLSQSNSTP
jgi:endo-1,4-beta-xylanase